MKAPEEEQTRTALRAYAQSLQPPPVEVILARVSREQGSTNPRHQRPARGPRRRALAVATAGALGVTAVTATVVFSFPQLTRLNTPSTGAGPRALNMAPACPPGMPILDGGLQARHGGTDPTSGRLRTPLLVRAGHTLILDAHLPPTPADRRLRTITLYLIPPGQDSAGSSVASGTTTCPRADQHTVRMTLTVPPMIPAGTYDLLEIGTWPAPSTCGQIPTDDHGQKGTSRTTIASVIVSTAVH